MNNIFIDTNLAVYTIDDGDPIKQRKARSLMDKIMATANPVISTQVLQEFYHAATSKLGIDKLLAKKIVHNLQNMIVVQITPAIIEQGIDISITAKLSFWDGLIIAAAVYADCETLLSEDLSDGQIINGVKIVNPFTYQF